MLKYYKQYDRPVCNWVNNALSIQEELCCVRIEGREEVSTKGPPSHPSPCSKQGQIHSLISLLRAMSHLFLRQGFQNFSGQHVPVLDHCHSGKVCSFFSFILSGFPLLQLVTICILLLCIYEKNQALCDHPYPRTAKQYKGIAAEQSPPPKMKVGASHRNSML